MARRQMGRERQGHTLQATALVNELYLRLVDVRQVRGQNRAQFFAARLESCDASWWTSPAPADEKRGGGAQRDVR